ncbi:MAG: PilN domain-containing protein [Nitrospirae bacterium]|nr:PilN domain-containing protein [Nitrospirota bacterium]
MIKINLLSEQKKIKRTKPAKAHGKGVSIVFLAAIIPIIVGVIAAAYIFILSEEVSSLNLKSEANKKTIAALQGKLKEMKNQEELKKNLIMRTTLIETLRKNQSIPVIVLDTVSRHLPEGVWLTSLSYTGRVVAIEGASFANSEIVAYVENFKKIDNLQDVALEESKQEKMDNTDVYKFKIKFKIKE